MTILTKEPFREGSFASCLYRLYAQGLGPRRGVPWASTMRRFHDDHDPPDSDSVFSGWTRTARSMGRSWLLLRSLLATAAEPLTPIAAISVASSSGRPMSA
jgi:hypothetical protein